MARHPDRQPSVTPIEGSGVARPGKGWWAWSGDAHFLAVVLAAVPVWLTLGMAVGDDMHVAIGWQGWLSLALIQPVAEELVFRGVLQGQLLRLSAARSAGPVTFANLLTTVAFVAMHLVTQPPAWAIAVAAPSLVFGHMRDRFGSVLPAMVVHALYNAGFGLTAWWVNR